MASPLQPNLREIHTNSVYKQNCTLKVTEFCLSFANSIHQVLESNRCAPKIALRSFGCEKEKRENICVTKAAHTCASFWTLMTALFIPFESADTIDYSLFSLQ